MFRISENAILNNKENFGFKCSGNGLQAGRVLKNNKNSKHTGT